MLLGFCVLNGLEEALNLCFLFQQKGFCITNFLFSSISLHVLDRFFFSFSVFLLRCPTEIGRSASSDSVLPPPNCLIPVKTFMRGNFKGGCMLFNR